MASTHSKPGYDRSYQSPSDIIAATRAGETIVAWARSNSVFDGKRLQYDVSLELEFLAGCTSEELSRYVETELALQYREYLHDEYCADQ